jgi:hypothetical protein
VFAEIKADVCICALSCAVSFVIESFQCFPLIMDVHRRELGSNLRNFLKVLKLLLFSELISYPHEIDYLTLRGRESDFARLICLEKYVMDMRGTYARSNHADPVDIFFTRASNEWRD